MENEIYLQKNLAGLSHINNWTVVCLFLCMSVGVAHAEFADTTSSKLEQVIESKEDAAALARLQEKIKTHKIQKNGHARSEYMDYIQSRLKEAFQKTIAYTIPNPNIVVRLFIDMNGKLSRKQVERSSGDRVFDISVLRAIDLASENFFPPPDNKVFEEVFLFKPNGLEPNGQ